MRLSDLLAHLDPIGVSGPVDRPISRITHDSRLAGREDVFVAIQGARSDGRAFARTLEVAAVVCEGPVEALPGVTVVTVADARLALAKGAAAVAGAPGAAIPVVGITGTNGKTTTSWMIEAIAEEAGWRAGVIGTTGFRVAGVSEPAAFTTPEAPVIQSLLARMRDAGCRVVAMEVSSIGLALRRVDGVPFQVGVFTSFSQDHLDFHGTMEAYLAAKARLFRELLAPGATALGNGEDPAWELLKPRSGRVWSYGLGVGFDFGATPLHAGLAGTEAAVRTPAGEGHLRVALPGAHNLSNALAALGAGLALGIPLSTCLSGLAALKRVPGRLDPVPNGAGIAVFVDYAHTPDALERVLAVLRPLTPGRLLTVMGCGGDRDRGKRPRMGRVAEQGSDGVIVTSDNPRSEDPAAIAAEIAAGITGPYRLELDRAAAIRQALAEARPGDCVLIAGKGHETTQMIGSLVLPFDDRAVAAAALAERGCAA